MITSTFIIVVTRYLYRHFDVGWVTDILTFTIVLVLHAKPPSSKGLGGVKRWRFSSGVG